MLYLVGTPIGNLKDITLRALETLKEVDVIACEDTRTSSKLLNHYGISKPKLAYHDHNAEKMRPRLLALLREGKKVAYITDGGMPLISDPGYKLVVACQNEALPYTVIPGPSAPIAALCLSGLSPDRFFFSGFLPSKQKGRREAFDALKNIQGTLIFFEAPQRLVDFLKDAREILGDRKGCVSREITKVYEEARKESLSLLYDFYQEHPPRGEIVVLIEGASSQPDFNEEDLDAELKECMKDQAMKDAASAVAKKFGRSKREIYQRALSLKSEKTSLS